MRKVENLSLREAIVEIVAAHSPVSTKKIYQFLQEKMNSSVSYQGVHKSLKKLAEQKKLLKQDGEYYLSSKTINHFLTTAQEIKKNQHPYNQNTNYLSFTLKHKAVRLVPFVLGNVDLEKDKIQILAQDEQKDTFEFDKTLYVYFKKTGICIQLFEEEVRNQCRKIV